MLTSEYEGFPNAMLEAMALGLPCVAFDCPSGPRELADGGAAAVIVPPGDVDALVTALQNLAANPEARRTLGARAAAFVRQKFAEHRIIDDWDRVFKRVMGR
jgi:glycosyltransferase involved in cell wall biosynthesis